MSVADQKLKEIYELLLAHTTERQKINQELAITLLTLIKQCPDMRFSQILQNFGFVDVIELHKNIQEFNGNVWADEFFKEPKEILKRVQETVIKIREQS